MKAICTYCAGPKNTDSRMLPAVRRYISERIDQLYRAAQEQGVSFLILSGEFGMLRPEAAIPWYDHLLQADEVDQLVAQVALVLSEVGVTELQYFTADAEVVIAVAPYLELARRACSEAGVEIEVQVLAGDPD
jgi:hypothetical protein